MSFCKKCGVQIDDEDAFCGTCGTPLNAQNPARQQHTSRANGAHEQPQQNSRRKAFVPATQTDDGAAGYARVKVAKLKTAQGWRKFFLVVAAISLALTILVESIPGSPSSSGWFWALCLVSSLIACAFVRPSAWTESEYYSVPGSRDSNGSHRCIHCGGVGIHRHGEYKSEVKYADCSNCHETLWIS
jgi:hypothetical protein